MFTPANVRHRQTINSYRFSLSYLFRQSILRLIVKWNFINANAKQHARNSNLHLSLQLSHHMILFARSRTRCQLCHRMIILGKVYVEEVPKCIQL